MKNVIKNLNDYFINNELEQLLEVIIEKLDDGNLKNNSFLLLSRVRNINNKINSGVLSNEEEDVMLNKLRLSILNLIENYEEYLKLNNCKPPDQNHINDKSVQNVQYHYGTGDNIIGNKIINKPIK